MNDLQEYLTIGEAAARLKLSPKTVKNKMAAGIFKKGIHFFSPLGMGPRFKWSALVLWMEQADLPPSEASTDGIPRARGYSLGQSGKKNQIAA
jgi:hypothetical protein